MITFGRAVTMFKCFASFSNTWIIPGMNCVLNKHLFKKSINQTIFTASQPRLGPICSLSARSKNGIRIKGWRKEGKKFVFIWIFGKVALFVKR